MSLFLRKNNDQKDDESTGVFEGLFETEERMVAPIALGGVVRRCNAVPEN